MLKLSAVGAHPDDPETGCGGTMILFHDAGYDVVSMYLTRGEAGIQGKTHDEAAAIRVKEAENACKLTGARPVFLSQVDGSTEITRERYDEMLEAIRSVAERKRAACDCHVSQGIDDLYEGWHGPMEQFRGMECGVQAAEAFVRLAKGESVNEMIFP